MYLIVVLFSVYKVKNANIEIQPELVNESLGNGNNYRQDDWSESVAVGSKDFVETIKKIGSTCQRAENP